MAVAVLDIGKTNVKLSAVTADGRIAETLSTANPVLPGPPWVHHDLAGLNRWLTDALAALARRHGLRHVIAVGHGAAGMLTGDGDSADGLALPMADYEQPTPAEVADYPALAGDYASRGSAVMPGMTHTARQLLLAERTRPQDFVAARHCLGVPQYWAWRLSGTAVSEASTLAAQSHLWTPGRGWAPIVAARGWGRLMPEMVHAGADLGALRPGAGLPPLRVHAGAHDSSAGFHRYQAAGMAGMVVVSTGTWIVALTDAVPQAMAEPLTLNADPAGNPLAGALAMGGRTYARIAGPQPADARADTRALHRLVAGGAARTAAERHALAVLTVALDTVALVEALASGLPVVLDGSFLRDPAFAALVAALRPGRRTLVNAEPYGVALGAAALATGQAPPLALTDAAPLSLPGLSGYAEAYRHGGAA